MKNKKIIILNHNGGRLCNQLWLFISVCAYCLDRGYRLENHSFFEYGDLFDIPENNRIIDLIFYRSYYFLRRRVPAGRQKRLLRIYRKIYNFYTSLIKFFSKWVLYAPDSGTPEIHYLMPTKNTDAMVSRFENNSKRKMYFSGWLFRNPVGIEKYRQEIKEYFMPKKYIRESVGNFMDSLRSKYEYIVGVHIRQGDHKFFYESHLANPALFIERSQLFFKQEEVKNIIDDFLAAFNKNREKVLFVICSDGDVDKTIFGDLNIKVSRGSAVEDLFILAATDLIIGADSTFGAFASYYGNIPFIVFERKIDWDFYKNKNKYFENKKCKMVHY